MNPQKHSLASGHSTTETGNNRPSTVIFVCTMNICRSPLLATVFAASIDGTDVQWAVDSRGTHAVPGADVCPVAVSLLEGYVPEHRARRVQADELTAADLILTATTRERRHLAHLAPSLRPRTFTVGEALLLARLDDQPTWLAQAPGASVARRFSALLNARRGLAPVPAANRRTRPGLPDIPDVHSATPRRHLSGLKAAQRDVRELANHISLFAGRS